MHDITAHPPSEVGVHNGNEGILNEHGLEDSIEIQHYGDDHGQDDDIIDNPPRTWPKGLLISRENFKYVCMSLLPK